MDSIFRAKGYIFGQDIIDASHDGNLDASFLLAQMYSYGIAGAVPNRRMAFQLYISLADNGVTEAKAMAGYMLLYGYGVEADASKGLDLVTEAANMAVVWPICSWVISMHKLSQPPRTFLLPRLAMPRRKLLA